MNTHYCVAVMDGGSVAQGMYTRSQAYATADLARQCGTSDRHLRDGPRCVVMVETRPAEDGSRRLVREVIVELVEDTRKDTRR